MGGKTQQRVAGNVKPSSSRRVRELLFNKHGSGNQFATFSTLSSDQRSEQCSNVCKVEHLSSNSPKLEEKTEEVLEPIKGESQEHSEAKALRPVLVLKRVGNREFFTRTKVPIESSSQQDATSIDSAREPNPTHQIVSANEFVKDELDLPSSDIQSDTLDEQSELPSRPSFESESDNESDVESCHCNNVDFDDLLDRVSEVLAMIEQRPTKESLDYIEESDMEKESELIRLLSSLVRKFYTDLSIVEWDLVTKSTLRWITLVTKTNNLLNLTEDKNIFCIRVTKFTNQLITLAKKCDDPKFIENCPMLQSIIEDWKSFSSSQVYRELIVTYFKLALAEGYTNENLVLIRELTALVLDVDPKFLITYPEMPHNPEPILDPEIVLPKKYSFCKVARLKSRGFHNICSMLRKNDRSFSILAHSMLNKIMDSICEDILVKFDDSAGDQEEHIEDVLLLPPQTLFCALTSRDLMMSALLNDYKSKNISVTIDPKSDAYNCTLSYLLMWDVVIKFIVSIEKEASHCIIHSLKKLGLIQRFLDNIFLLLPPIGDIKMLDSEIGCFNSPMSGQSTSLTDFLKGDLHMNLKRCRNEIELSAIRVYFSMARHMPVTVRKWYNNNSNKRLSNLVNEYTVKHISSVVCALEMETVQAKCQERDDKDKLNNLTIKARLSSREVYAIYTRDEFKLELTIKLPINYPLGPVQIDGGKRVGVTDVKWRSWLLQLTLFLAHQNGPILDGIDLWRRNIDKRFEGVEKCMICFSILHSNYQLPKKKCRTCSKVFHNLCLYKWFESSGNSTCPLCRNIW